MATNARQILSRALDKWLPWLPRFGIWSGADIPHKNSIVPKPSSRKAMARKRQKYCDRRRNIYGLNQTLLKSTPCWTACM
jgi:hypothetical protein